MDQGLVVGTYLLSEGKATANAVEVAKEVAAASGGATQLQIPLGPNAGTALALVGGNYADPNSQASVGAYASYFASIPTSEQGNPPYFSYYWKNYTGRQDTSIDPSQVTGAAIIEKADGTLKSMTITRTGASGTPSTTIYDVDAGKRSDLNKTNG